jgi:hypothetical protein
MHCAPVHEIGKTIDSATPGACPMRKLSQGIGLLASRPRQSERWRWWRCWHWLDTRSHRNLQRAASRALTIAIAVDGRRRQPKLCPCVSQIVDSGDGSEPAANLGPAAATSNPQARYCLARVQEFIASVQISSVERKRARPPSSAAVCDRDRRSPPLQLDADNDALTERLRACQSSLLAS